MSITHNRRDLKKLATGLFFISPWIVGFLAFIIYPMLASLYFSLTHYDVLTPPVFAGLANYKEMLSGDDLFFKSLGNTFYFVVIGVPLGVVVSFLTASLLNQRIWARPIFRTIFFVPSITPLVVIAITWLWIYDPSFGLINNTLSSLGLKRVPWLTSPALAKPSLILIGLWLQGSTMLIFLAALQGIPRSLYESATIDGANSFRKFLNITIPMCTPSILFALITGLIGTFQAFGLPWIMTGGGPNNSTMMYGVYLYQNAFVFARMGYASAMAWLLFIIIIIFTLMLLRVSNRFVHYSD